MYIFCRCIVCQSCTINFSKKSYYFQLPIPIEILSFTINNFFVIFSFLLHFSLWQYECKMQIFPRPVDWIRRRARISGCRNRKTNKKMLPQIEFVEGRFFRLIRTLVQPWPICHFTFADRYFAELVALSASGERNSGNLRR